MSICTVALVDWKRIEKDTLYLCIRECHTRLRYTKRNLDGIPFMLLQLLQNIITIITMDTRLSDMD